MTDDAEPGWDWALARRLCVREARRLLACDEDAEEAVQEAMARAWRRRSTCRRPEAYTAWLRQITRNEALRLIAQRRRTAERELPAQEQHEPSTDGESETVLGMLATEQALCGLSTDERRLIELRYMDDLTQPEVARVLELPEGTVKVRLHRIRRRLRTALAEAA